jgi:hypothetical protein
MSGGFKKEREFYRRQWQFSIAVSVFLRETVLAACHEPQLTSPVKGLLSIDAAL